MGNPPFEYIYISYKKWWFSIAMSVYQRVLLVDMNLGYHGYQVEWWKNPHLWWTKSLLLFFRRLFGASVELCWLIRWSRRPTWCAASWWLNSQRIHGLNGRLVSHQMPYHPTRTSFENWSIGGGLILAVLTKNLGVASMWRSWKQSSKNT